MGAGSSGQAAACGRLTSAGGVTGNAGGATGTAGAIGTVAAAGTGSKVLYLIITLSLFNYLYTCCMVLM